MSRCKLCSLWQKNATFVPDLCASDCVKEEEETKTLFAEQEREKNGHFLYFLGFFSLTGSVSISQQKQKQKNKKKEEEEGLACIHEKHTQKICTIYGKQSALQVSFFCNFQKSMLVYRFGTKFLRCISLSNSSMHGGRWKHQ